MSLLRLHKILVAAAAISSVAFAAWGAQRFASGGGLAGAAAAVAGLAIAAALVGYFRTIDRRYRSLPKS